MSKTQAIEEQIIPRIIIQSEKRKHKVKLISGYDRIIFNEEQAAALIKEHFTDKVLECFNDLDQDGKFDLWKFCFLYVRGGVFLRRDLDLQVHLDKLVAPPETLYYDSNFNVSDGLIAMQKNNPVMMDAINLMCNRVALLDDDNAALNVLDKIPDSSKTDPEKIAQMCIATEQEIDIKDVAQLKTRMRWWATGPILLNDVVYSRVTGKILSCSEYVLPTSLKERIVKQLLKGNIDEVCSPNVE